jgi:hypothetical protein
MNAKLPTRQPTVKAVLKKNAKETKETDDNP